MELSILAYYENETCTLWMDQKEKKHGVKFSYSSPIILDTLADTHNVNREGWGIGV